MSCHVMCSDVMRSNLLIYASIHADMQVEYTIKVTTGNVKNAGTDAKVYVTLYGEKQASGQINYAPSLKLF